MIFSVRAERGYILLTVSSLPEHLFFFASFPGATDHLRIAGRNCSNRAVTGWISRFQRYQPAVSDIKNSELKHAGMTILFLLLQPK
jgi:hypothetical protein